MRRCVAAAVIARQKNRCRRQRPPAARKLPRRVARVYAQRKEAWYVRVRRRWAPQEQGRVRDGGLKDFAEPRFVRGLRFVPLLVSGRRERYAKDHCANGSCGAPRERGGLPSGCPGPSACGIAVPLAAHHSPQRVDIAARGTPRRATVRGGAGAAAIGLPLAVGGTIIGAETWSPQPKHHRKQQRHQLC